MDHNQSEDSALVRSHSLIGAVSLGAFWCVAGMFLVGPIAAVTWHMLQQPAPRATLPEMLSNGFATVFFLVVWLPGYLILAPAGAAVGAVRWRKARRTGEFARSQVIVSALIVDALLAMAFTTLAILVRT